MSEFLLLGGPMIGRAEFELPISKLIADETYIWESAARHVLVRIKNGDLVFTDDPDGPSLAYNGQRADGENNRHNFSLYGLELVK